MGSAKRPPASRRGDDGRVHLRVDRDELGQATSLGLSGPLFEESWQDRLVVATASTAYGYLSGGSSRQAVLTLIRKVLEAASQAARQALEQSAARPLACGSGCDHCCHQSVGVTPPEALVLFDHLRSSLSESELEEVQRRVSEADEKAAGLSPSERHSPDLPCPLLVDHRCSAYEARPLSCRGANSLDADSCRLVLRDVDARTSGPDGASPVPRYTEILGVSQAMSAGLQLAGSELFGLDMQPLELRTALRLLLEDHESVITSWLSGGDAFAPAASPSSGSDRTDS